MKNKMFYISPIVLILTLACGFGGNQTEIVFPTVGVGQLETAIAETSSAAVALTNQAASPTPSPTATAIVTFTPSSKTLEGIDSTLIKHPDGSAEFIDKNAAYSIAIPSGWFAMRINQPEYYEAWALPEMKNPRFEKALNSIKNLDPKIIRLSAIDIRANHLDQAAPNLIFGWYPNITNALDTESEMKSLSKKYADGAKELNATVLSASEGFLLSGLKIGFFELEETINEASEEVKIYQRMVFFRSGTGYTQIAFTTAEALKGEMLPEFLSMLETISVK